ncbi:MAG: cell division protein FtsA [Pseudomonadota bacterium]
MINALSEKRPVDFFGPTPLPQRKSVIVSVLDVGSSKMSCIIARLRPIENPVGGSALRQRTHAIEVLGFGHYRSHGLKSGYVTDTDQAERAIRQAVHQAERMADITLDSIIASLSAGRIQSEILAASVRLGGHAVSEHDIAKVMHLGRDHAIAPNRSVLHAMPIGFALDGKRGILDPRGMYGVELGVDMHMISADVGPLRNLENCINAAHLGVEGYVTTAHASGLAVLSDDEMELGTACIDFGAGTTSIGIFYDGEFIHSDIVPLGGHHITMDLARGLSTSIEEAERLKTLYGSALPSPADDRDVLSVSAPSEAGDDAVQSVPRSALTRIIRPRVEEILEMTRDRLQAASYHGLAAKRLVITGGASQMTGLNELARRLLSRNIRLAKPYGVEDLPEAGKTPAFAAVAGLLVYPQRVRMVPRASAIMERATGTNGYLGRVSQWLRSSL